MLPIGTSAVAQPLEEERAAAQDAKCANGALPVAGGAVVSRAYLYHPSFSTRPQPQHLRHVARRAFLVALERIPAILSIRCSPEAGLM
jgi:hypothetical protein